MYFHVSPVDEFYVLKNNNNIFVIIFISFKYEERVRIQQIHTSTMIYVLHNFKVIQGNNENINFDVRKA